MTPTSSTPLMGDEIEGERESYLLRMAAAADIAHNRPWILTIGIFNVIGGILCLISPVVASLVAEALIAWTFTFIGIANLSGIFFAEPNIRAYHGILGLFQVVLGIVMINHPFETLFTFTIWLAIIILLDGIYTLTVCGMNRDLKGWGVCLVSGLASIVVAVTVLSTLPESSMFTIGVLLGVNLITVGNIRIHIAWEGRAAIEEGS